MSGIYSTHTIIMDLQQIKQRFGIIGNSAGLNRAIGTALQVAPTDLSVLIMGESGTGKEVFSQIIHQNSARKHNQYIAVNCGAIPDGTIDSELFGHEKGAFTGAIDSRKGYFEVADGGTIFLDEVGELPLSSQVRLLRVLEAGEYIRVGSSKIQKTNVRVVAATNVNLLEAIKNGKFREDLYYRLNTVPITIPALRERPEDIILLFRKFANDCADRYRMPSLRLDDSAQDALINYRWPGNIRQLKNIAEQISIVEQQRNISSLELQHYLPHIQQSNLPALVGQNDGANSYASERELLYKILFDMKKDVGELKKLVLDIVQQGGIDAMNLSPEHNNIIQRLYHDGDAVVQPTPAAYRNEPRSVDIQPQAMPIRSRDTIQDTHEIVEESLFLEDREIELIKKALEKHGGKRKNAAHELGISERTLYRKIREFNLE